MTDTTTPNPTDLGDGQNQPPGGGTPADLTPAPLDLEPPKPADPPAGPEPVEYEPTGDAGLDMALAYVGNFGFKPDSPELVAVLEKGDFGPLEAALAALGDKAKGYDKAIKAGREAYDRKVTNASEAEKAIRSTIETAAGGAANWAAIQKWAAASAEPAEKKTINAALKLGGVVAEDMVRRLAASFEASGQSATAPKSATKEEAGSGAAPVDGNAPLSPNEFSRAVAELGRKVGAHKLYDTNEYKQLKARRQRYAPK